MFEDHGDMSQIVLAPLRRPHWWRLRDGLVLHRRSMSLAPAIRARMVQPDGAVGVVPKPESLQKPSASSPLAVVVVVVPS